MENKTNSEKFFGLVEPSVYETIMLALRFRMVHCTKQKYAVKSIGFPELYDYWTKELEKVVNAYDQLL